MCVVHQPQLVLLLLYVLGVNRGPVLHFIHFRDDLLSTSLQIYHLKQNSDNRVNALGHCLILGHPEGVDFHAEVVQVGAPLLVPQKGVPELLVKVLVEHFRLFFQLKVQRELIFEKVFYKFMKLILVNKAILPRLAHYLVCVHENVAELCIVRYLAVLHYVAVAYGAVVIDPAGIIDKGEGDPGVVDLGGGSDGGVHNLGVRGLGLYKFEF